MSHYESWWEEKRSAYLYGVMAKKETNILHQRLFLDLQTAAEKQALIWEQSVIAETPQKAPTFKPDLRTRIVAILINIFGAERLHSMLAAMKIRGMSIFTRFHSEHKHTTLSASSNLRAAVFGVNDGLISNVSLMLGFAGNQANPHVMVLAGVAGLLAGACSMGAGEYISVRSQREVFEYQIAIEKQELEEYPEEETEELSLIYQARGVSKEDADLLSTIMIKNPETGLNTLAREELGLNPDDLVSPIGAMLFSFISFAIGAAIPLLPFLLMQSPYTLLVSISATAIALFLIGTILSLFTNRNPVISGMRMLFIGVVAGSVTFYIGKLLDVSI